MRWVDYLIRIANRESKLEMNCRLRIGRVSDDLDGTGARGRQIHQIAIELRSDAIRRSTPIQFKPLATATRRPQRSRRRAVIVKADASQPALQLQSQSVIIKSGNKEVKIQFIPSFIGQLSSSS